MKSETIAGVTLEHIPKILEEIPNRSTPEIYRKTQRYDIASAASMKNDPGETLFAQGRYILRPILPSLQTAPVRWLERRFPKKIQRVSLAIGLCLIWSLAFAVLSDKSISPIKVNGIYQPVQQLSCVDSFWLPDNGCGILGDNCPNTGESIAFHCPANCANVKLEQPYFVGPRTVVDQPLVIGGAIYRSDSWICAAAVHADVLSNKQGGCAILSRMGQTNSYPESSWEGLVSVGVKTYFPHSYRFQLDSGFECQIKDQSSLLPYVSIAFITTLFLFSTSTSVPFFAALAIGFLHVRLSIENSDNKYSYPGFVHKSLGFTETLTGAAFKYLPVVVCSVLVYKRSFRKLTSRFAAPVEKALLWLGALWIGLMIGSPKPEHSFVVPCITTIILCHQVFYLHQVGILGRYLGVYAFILLAVVISVSVSRILAPFVGLALLLSPGFSIRTRPNLAYQGLLVGLLVYGLAQQSPLAMVGHLTRPAPTTFPELASLAPPAVGEPEIHVFNIGSNITFNWQTPVPPEVEGISMMVNDVERSRHMFSGQDAVSFFYDRTPQAVPDYVRFSWVKHDRLLGYGDAGVWEVGGAWSGLGRIDK